MKLEKINKIVTYSFKTFAIASVAFWIYSIIDAVYEYENALFQDLSQGEILLSWFIPIILIIFHLIWGLALSVKGNNNKIATAFASVVNMSILLAIFKTGNFFRKDILICIFVTLYLLAPVFNLIYEIAISKKIAKTNSLKGYDNK